PPGLCRPIEPAGESLITSHQCHHIEGSRIERNQRSFGHELEAELERIVPLIRIVFDPHTHSCPLSKELRGSESAGVIALLLQHADLATAAGHVDLQDPLLVVSANHAPEIDPVPSQL